MQYFCSTSIDSINNKEQIKQITKVLRLKQQDQIVIIYKNKHYLSEILEITNNIIHLKTIKELDTTGIELNYNINVYIPLLKGNKLDWILQKCTELGVSNFYFVEYQNSVRNNINWEHQLSRWNKIIIEAVEQSERTTLPVIHQINTLENILQNLPQEDNNIVFMERLEKNPPLSSSKKEGNYNLFFGPEGGFAPSEKELFTEYNINSQSLGRRILRAETAVLTGVVLASQVKNKLDFIRS